MGIFTVAFLLVVGVVFPVAVLRSARRLPDLDRVSRSQLYLSTVMSSAVLLLFALGAAWEGRLAVFGRFRWSAAAVAITAAWTLIQIGYLAYSLRRGDLEKSRFARLMSPQTRTERIQWIGLGLFAAVSEEIVYRSVLFTLLLGWLDHWILAALASAAIFGISHAVQGVQGGILAGLVGFGNQALVLATGSLWYAIVTHFVYDLVAVMAIGAQTARGGVEAVPLPASAPPEPGTPEDDRGISEGRES